MGKRKRAIIKGYRKYKSKYARVAAIFNKNKLKSDDGDELLKRDILVEPEPIQDPPEEPKVKTIEKLEEIKPAKSLDAPRKEEKVIVAEVADKPKTKTTKTKPAAKAKSAKAKTNKKAASKKKTSSSWFKNTKSKKKSTVKED